MTSPQIRPWIAAGVLAGVLALSGCGAKEEPAASATPTDTPAPAATPATAVPLPAALRGSWKRTMKARDWKPAGGFPAGAWRFDADGKGAVDVYLPKAKTVDFSTQFVAKGHRLTIDSVPVCPGESPAPYKWRASGGKLTLTLAGKDPCKPRAALFGGTWTHAA
jgi:hypothetical protein